jgi:hypothetical protein
MTIGDCGFAGASLSFAGRIGASAKIAPMQIATGECLITTVWQKAIFSSIPTKCDVPWNGTEIGGGFATVNFITVYHKVSKL